MGPEGPTPEPAETAASVAADMPVAGGTAMVPLGPAPMGSWKIRRLPDHLKMELDRRLSDGTVRSCRQLSKWLGQNGYSISHAALHKYGRKFENRLEAVRLASEQARVVCEQFKDDDVTMQQALMRLVQTQLFEVLVSANQGVQTVRRRAGADEPKKTGGRGSAGASEPKAAEPKAGEPKVVGATSHAGDAVTVINLTALARSVAGLARADAEHRKWSALARERVAAVEKKLEAARGEGLSESMASEIRGMLMGLDQ